MEMHQKENTTPQATFTPERRILHPWERVLLDLMSVESVTGNESRVAITLENCLSKMFPGANVERQYVGENRWNVIMQKGRPSLTLTTHIDVVPGGPPPSYTHDAIIGRGACDAKGQLVAQLWGLKQAISNGVTDYRCAYVVGEETDAIGARALISLPMTEYVLNGEPTNNKFIRQSWGAFEIELSAKGTNAHSSLGTGDSAVHKLIDDVYALKRDLPPGIDINVGVISGGVAPNIQAASASCDICARMRGSAEPVRELLRTRIKNSTVREKSPPTEGLSLFVPDFAPERDVEVRYASDCSVYALVSDKVMLFGPGSISEAHTDNESLDRGELRKAAAMIAHLIVSLESQKGKPKC